jgi:hypothetical protein
VTAVGGRCVSHPAEAFCGRTTLSIFKTCQAITGPGRRNLKTEAVRDSPDVSLYLVIESTSYISTDDFIHLPVAPTLSCGRKTLA